MKKHSTLFSTLALAASALLAAPSMAHAQVSFSASARVQAGVAVAPRFVAPPLVPVAPNTTVLAAPAVAQPPQVVPVYAPPPRHSLEREPTLHRPGFVWVPGYYAFNGAQYTWVEGSWARPPSPNSMWSAPQFTRRGRRMSYRAGFWTPAPVPVQAPEPVAYVPPAPASPPVFPQPHAHGHSGVRYLLAGQTVSNTLNAGDATVDSGAYADTYQLPLQAGQSVTLYVQGQPFPGSRSSIASDVTVDVLFNGQTLAHDDDSGEGRDAQLVFTAQQAGLYQVRVSTWGSIATEAAYTLQVRPGVQPTGRP